MKKKGTVAPPMGPPVFMKRIYRDMFDIKKWIEDSGDYSLDITACVLKSGYTRAHLQRQFFLATGVKLGTFLRHRRIEHGADLLAGTSWPTLDIALECGYQNVHDFSRAFKAHFGITPRQFRINSPEYLGD